MNERESIPRGDIPSEEEIARVLAGFRPRPGPRFYARMARTPWGREPRGLPLARWSAVLAACTLALLLATLGGRFAVIPAQERLPGAGSPAVALAPVGSATPPGEPGDSAGALPDTGPVATAVAMAAAVTTRTGPGYSPGMASGYYTDSSAFLEYTHAAAAATPSGWAYEDSAGRARPDAQDDADTGVSQRFLVAAAAASPLSAALSILLRVLIAGAAIALIVAFWQRRPS